MVKSPKFDNFDFTDVLLKLFIGALSECLEILRGTGSILFLGADGLN